MDTLAAHNPIRKSRPYTLLIVCLFLLSACASIPSEVRDESDPFEGFNRTMYSFNETVDDYVMKPVAKGYNFVMPDFANKGVTNFFSNIDDVVVMVNDLFQFKFSHAGRDLGRIGINSTIGLLGFIDVASMWDIPKRDEDFGQTLGHWGLGTGPYLVLPLLGPSDIRDASGRIVDSFIDPITYVRPIESRNGLIILEAIDIRADLLSASRVFEEAALDPYLFVRDAYLQRRQNQVFDGAPPLEDPYDDYEPLQENNAAKDVSVPAREPLPEDSPSPEDHGK
ncbi:MAG: VacJ family lipoprotein [Gammaproteobacteria bacterium]|nr:VacJ family lipoprotein [Gammaproteobacteria bacterium]